jgi:hypothetical protein
MANIDLNQWPLPLVYTRLITIAIPSGEGPNAVQYYANIFGTNSLHTHTAVAVDLQPLYAHRRST